MLDTSNNILKGFSNTDEILKGKVAQLGEIREWQGGKYKKTVAGWVPVSDSSAKPKQMEGEANVEDVKNTLSTKSSKAAVGLGVNDTHLFEEVRLSQSPEELTNNVKNILNSQSSKAEKCVELFKQGLRIHEIVNTLGSTLSATIDYINQAKNRGMFGNVKNSTPEETVSKEKGKEAELDIDDIELPEISVKDKWDSYEHFGMMIGLKRNRAMFAYGTGGVGKTFTLLDQEQGVFGKLKLRKGEINAVSEESDDDNTGKDDIVGVNPETGERFLKKDAYDYVTVTGKITPSRMFALMQEHNGKILVFDDCDSVITSGDDGVNVLKGALDTSGDGTISWEGSGNTLKSSYAGIKGAKPVMSGGKDPKPTGEYRLPKTFKFTGQVVFISNLPAKDVPQPLRSRSLMIDLTMNREQTLHKIESIAHKFKAKDPEGNEIHISENNRNKSLEFMRKYINKFNEADLNMRTFSKLAGIYQSVEDLDSPLSPEKIAISSFFK